MGLIERLTLAWNVFLKGAMADSHPELASREHLSSTRSDQMTAAPQSYLSALSDYGSHVWVRKSIKIIGDNFSALPVTIQRDGVVVPHHPLSEALSAVNNTMSSSDLWQQWVIDMMLGGEEFWELVYDAGGRLSEIWPRQPHTVQLQPDQQRIRYFQVAGYSIEDQWGSYSLSPQDCVHFKFFNPSNPWRGISVISAVRYGIIIDQLAQMWSKNFLAKGARPDYAVVAPQGTTKTERDQLISAIESQYGGAANAHKPMALEEGVTDIKILSFPPKDLEWVAQRQLSRTEIVSMFGVPEELAGFGKDTYQNFTTAHKVFYVLTIQPLAQLRDTHLTEWAQRYGMLAPNETVATDFSGVAVLAENITERLDQGRKLFDMGVPFNRVDELIGLGVGAITGGDVGYLPISLLPVGYVPSKATPAETTPPALVDVPPVKRVKGIEYGSPEHSALWDAFIKRVDPHETTLGAAVYELLLEQRDEVLATLRAEAKDATSAKDNPFDLAAWRKRFITKCGTIISRTINDAGTAAGTAIGFSFNVTNPNVTAFLRAREQRFAERVNDTTYRQLQDTLSAGITLGESIPKLEARVIDTMTLRMNQSKETIARTEVIGASNGGTLLSWQQSARVASKMWLATMDDRTRDSHASAHGQTVAIDADFTVGGGSGPAPGQIGLAAEDCNCRCTMTAVLKDA